MGRRSIHALGAAAALGLAISTMSVGPAVASEHAHVQHVLLISVDGMHQTDLAWYVRTHPDSTLAALTRHGLEFTNARTPFPSDSFPGMVGQVTGGNPRTTGVYYDDSWNAALLRAGTSVAACQAHTVAPGVEVTYFEAADKNQHALDAGQGLSGLPGSILQMTSDPRDVIDPSQLPVDPSTCQPVYPNTYLKVNTVFEVARAAGLGTAWSDKHPAYLVVSGPSGTGVQDFFTPEINSDAPTLGSPIDWTKDNLLTQQYDNYKVEAVLNWINGWNHQHTRRVPTPAIFGMNFQSVSTGQKLPKSNGLQGGYIETADGGVVPGPVLGGALDFVNAEVGRMVAALRARGLDDSTAIILSAKHGQSPEVPQALTRIDDGPIMDGLNAAWNAAGHAGTLVAFNIDDDGMLIWLTDRSQAAADFAKIYLLTHPGVGNDVNGDPKTLPASGLLKVFEGPSPAQAQVLAGSDAAAFIGVPAGDARVPDIIGIVQTGVVYTGGHGKIAEHGGNNFQDRAVPLLVSGAGVGEGGVSNKLVETTQIAPTILQLLGLDPNALQAVQIEHTQSLLSTGEGAD